LIDSPHTVIISSCNATTLSIEYIRGMSSLIVARISVMA